MITQNHCFLYQIINLDGIRYVIEKRDVIARCVLTTEDKDVFLAGFFGYGLLFPIGFLVNITYVVLIFTPYLREKGTYTRWLGFMGIGDIIWWLYAFFVRDEWTI